MSDHFDEEIVEALKNLLDSGREVEIREIVMAVLKTGTDNEIVDLVIMAMECLQSPISNDQLILGITNLRLWREDNS